MFILSKDRTGNASALKKMQEALSPIVEPEPLHEFQVGEYWLSWVKVRPYEMLNQYDDGFLIGPADFCEHEEPVMHHRSKVPEEIHPLLQSTRITINQNKIIVEPCNITNIFWAKDVVSDMQLLIARLRGLVPSPEDVAVLSTVGYLPGNLSLFAKVRKIPFLYSILLPDNTIEQTKVYPQDSVADDEQMVSRLISLVPETPFQAIGMSSGYDSRFVLGTLYKAGVKPILYHVQDSETELVTLIARQLGLELRIESSESELLPPYIYTISSDAQIYFRGGNYSKLRPILSSQFWYHSGLFADSIIKNAFKTAVKIPGGTQKILPKLIDFALLSLTPTEITGLKTFDRKTNVKDYLLQELSFGNQYHQFANKKEWANWFYYLHRGIRWSQATTADLALFVRPVFLLSDLSALSMGIKSRLWENFKKDRVRNLCKSLLPRLQVLYSDNPPVSTSVWSNGFYKIKYEYLDRYLVRKRERTCYQNSARRQFDLENLVDQPGFDQYFSASINNLIKDTQYSYSLKRSAVTLHYVLQFLSA